MFDHGARTDNSVSAEHDMILDNRIGADCNPGANLSRPGNLG